MQAIWFRRYSVLFLFATLIAACGSPYAGTYTAEVRVMEGREPTDDPGYTFEELSARVAEENPTLKLHGNKRFTWNTGSAVNEGTWRIDGGTLYLREDVYNGKPIQSALQKDREWAITRNGEINTGSYSAYNLELYYVPQ